MTPSSAPRTVPVAMNNSNFPFGLGDTFSGSTIISIAHAAERATLNLEGGPELVYELDLTSRLWRLARERP